MAVGLVLVAHAADGAGFRSPLIGPAAALGVDLFFVLSGFLITSILLDAKGAPGYFRTFYARRALRILPLYYGLLFLLLAASYTRYAEDLSTADFVSRQVWYWTHTSNWLMAAPSELFRAGRAGLNAVWSLSIEEQFYAVWPLVVLWTTPRALARVCGALLVIAFVARVALGAMGVPPLALQLLTPTRLDPIVVGSLISVAARAPRWRARLRSPWGGLVPLAVLVAVPVTGRAGIVAGAAASVIAVGLGGGLALALRPGPHALLASGMLRWLGKYSYALYLLQFPVLRFLRVHGVTGDVIGRPAHVVLSAAILCTLAFLSWHLWEKRWLALKDRVPQRTVDQLDTISPL